ncbi:endo alpha-1,4 polygalactosaminidase [Clavibacter phaseoli]|uniref:endo alpha-1,4 polygalactosaminidase n=2 Tax=Clavibacter phaseoli TaxID=1734031 RepID=UPI001F1F8770|nr:endo alpha-1,4 polygalactosaminidase [Clavibacter phaseoli]UKF31664.1 endo alpha-1,4 polygalactosaminidase [Clavibacter phaseoli]UKF37584.1 endo alpha-1,4 polygalactosaminidase [Clavibacter phaseoli]
MRPLLSAALVTAALVALSGCASAAPRAGSAASGGGPGAAAASGVLASDARAAVTLPPVGTGFDYQLGGASAVPAGVGIVVRDSTDEPAAGAYGVCYVNGFQTQPGETWPDDLLVQGDDGPLVDPDWDDEFVLDTSTAPKRAAIAARQAATVDRCADAGFQAVEFDNLDSWNRSEGALDADDALALATLLVDHGHGRGLAVAQKNTTDIGSRGRDEAGFDFAIAEECDRWSECADYTAVYGPHVLDVEYADDLLETTEVACARILALDPAPRAIVRDRDLVPASGDGYAYAAC